MAAGKINIQANDGKIYSLTPEDGASGNVALTLPKEGGMLTVDAEVVHKTGDETIAGVKTLADGLKLQNQNVSPFSGFKNYIINGSFDVWQRGTSQTTTGYGSADRWQPNIGGNGTFTIAKYVGDTMNGRKINTCAIGLNVVGTTSYVGITTRLEDMMRFAGKTLTLSFYAISDSPTPIMVYYGRYYTSMVYSNAFIVGNGVSGGLIKYSATFTIPAYAGETYDSTNSFLEIIIKQERTTTGAFRIAQVQLEEGSVATPFENRPYGLELSLCQRYYESSYSNGVTVGSASTLGAKYSTTISSITAQGFTFIEPKRVPPTVAIYSPSGTAGYVWNSADIDNGSAVPSNIGTKGVRYLNNPISNWIANSGITYHYTASAEL